MSLRLQVYKSYVPGKLRCMDDAYLPLGGVQALWYGTQVALSIQMPILAKGKTSNLCWAPCFVGTGKLELLPSRADAEEIC